MNSLTDSVVAALHLIASLDAGLLAIVGRSLVVSALACLIACVVGLGLGAWLGVARFPGRSAVLALLNTFLAVPSVVVGLVVYLVLSRTGPLGFLGWLFSFKAMVLAQALLVLPACSWYSPWGALWRQRGICTAAPARLDISPGSKTVQG